MKKDKKRYCKKCRKYQKYLLCGFGNPGSLIGNGRYRCLVCGWEEWNLKLNTYDMDNHKTTDKDELIRKSELKQEINKLKEDLKK